MSCLGITNCHKYHVIFQLIGIKYDSPYACMMTILIIHTCISVCVDCCDFSSVPIKSCVITLVCIMATAVKTNLLVAFRTDRLHLPRSVLFCFCCL